MLSKTVLFAVAALAAATCPAAEFRAGAARVDITPAKDAALPMSGYGFRHGGFKGIHDNLYVRAIVMDDGVGKAAIVSCDVLSLSHAFWERMSERITARTGIPRERILLAAVHTHAAPALGKITDDEDAKGTAAYVAMLESRIEEAVTKAQQNLQPARAGAGTGVAKVNMNRRARMGDGGWWLGLNPDGPSDKTVAVVKFETASGQPIAVFSNYAMHGTGMGQENFFISGDVPGATARFVEQQFGGKVVAPWTSGAAGDQCPIYDRSPIEFDGVEAIGRILGEEVVRVANAIRTSSNLPIRAMQKVIACPGRKVPPGDLRRDDLKYTFLDADPAMIRLSLLTVGKIAFAGVSGEVLTMIGQRLKRESPFSNTIMVTHCNGSSGYLPDDAAYKDISYEILVTPVKPGCAENAIVNSFVEMLDKY